MLDGLDDRLASRTGGWERIRLDRDSAKQIADILAEQANTKGISRAIDRSECERITAQAVNGDTRVANKPLSIPAWRDRGRSGQIWVLYPPPATTSLMPNSGTTYHGTKNSIDEYLRQTLLTGTAIVLPVLISAFLVLLIVQFLSGLLNPLVIPIQEVSGMQSRLVPQFISLIVLVLTIFSVGAFTESRFGGDRLKEGLDATIAHIPGFRSIYGPLDQISTMLVEGDTQNFQEVVLVEFPKEGSYSLAFQTSHPPEKIKQATRGDDMLTVFMPMGPNPFMGGFILHISETEVHSVDLSVEEGISSIVSFGVAVEKDPHDPAVPLDLGSPEKTSAK